MTYGTTALLTKSEALKAFDDAVILVQRILEEVKSQNPQMEFKFDLNKD